MIPCTVPKAKANQKTFLLLILGLLFFFFLLSIVLLVFFTGPVQDVEVVLELLPRVATQTGSSHASPPSER